MQNRNAEDTRDWVGIKRAYENNTLTIIQICEQFGVSKGSFEHRCRKEQWMSRRARLTDRRQSTLGRLFDVLEAQVGKLANAGGETLGDKETQQLTELIKNFDKINTMSNGEAKADAPPEQRIIRDVRDKLAKRIDQFNRR